MTPTIAIVLPFRNAAATLAESVRSVCAQTVRDWVLLAIDDGSVDGGAELLAADPRIRLLRPGRVGLPSALRLGVTEARATGAPFLARFDADDLCRPDRLERQLSAFAEAPEVGVVDSRWWSPEGDSVSDGTARYRAWHDGITSHEDFLRELLVESPVCHPAVMMRVAALPPGPLYRDWDGPEDYELWLRLVRAGVRFAKVSERLVGWRDSPDRATRTDERYRREAFFAAKWEHFRASFSARRVAVWGGGRGGRRWVRALAGEGRLAGVVEVDPRKVGGERHGCPVVAPRDLPELRPDLVVHAVGAPGARARLAQGSCLVDAPTVAVAGLAG